MKHHKICIKQQFHVAGEKGEYHSEMCKHKFHLEGLSTQYDKTTAGANAMISRSLLKRCIESLEKVQSGRMIRGLESMIYGKNMLKEFGMFRLEKEWLEGVITLFKYVKSNK